MCPSATSGHAKAPGELTEVQLARVAGNASRASGYGRTSLIRHGIAKSGDRAQPRLQEAAGSFVLQDVEVFVWAVADCTCRAYSSASRF